MVREASAASVGQGQGGLVPKAERSEDLSGSAPNTQRGFTLVELMISLVLFALLVAGVLAVAVSMTQGFREQRQVITTDMQVRAPMDYLGDVVRMASPGVANGDITTSAGDPACDYYGRGMFHVPPPGPTPNTTVFVTNNSPGPSPLIGTDQLDVLYASGGVVTSLTSPYIANTTSFSVVDATGIAGGDQLLITDTVQGHLVFVTSVAGNNINVAAPTPCSNANLPASGGYANTSLVIRVNHARFAIANDPQTSIPGLYMCPFTAAGQPGPPPANCQPVAEGIEDMQVALAQDSNADNIITKAAPNEWVFSPGGNAYSSTVQIRGLRVTLIGRAASQLTAGPGNLGRPGAEDHAPGPLADSFRRRLLTSTFETRNLGQSL